MSILTSILGGKDLGDLFKDIVGSFKLTPEKRAEIEQAIEQNAHVVRMKEYELQVKAMDAEAGIVEAQKAIIVAEMQQQDPFTKRARPMIVYAGLVAIFLVHVILPYVAYFTKEKVPPIELPADFWYVWGGVCSIWFIGRSFERLGYRSPAVKTITGSK